MIFFGAGATKELGIPTLQEFSEIMIEKLIINGYKNEVIQIKDSLDNFGLASDFEAIYSILLSLSDPYQAVQELGPVAAFFLKKRSYLPEIKDFQDMLETARIIIYENCYLNKEKESKILEHYDPLFKAIKAQNVYATYIYNGKSVGSKPLDTIIATTNYDMSLEMYFMSKGILYNDGYITRAQNPNIKDFDFGSIFMPFNHNQQRKIKYILIKLHGSIWQFERDNKLFKTYNDPDLAPINLRPNIGKEMMIYPTHQKDILEWRYYHFFNLFKKIEWDRLLVIGYSFRDQPINTSIIDRLKNDKNTRLIVFHPHPEKVINNLGYDVPDNQISRIKAHFGKEDGVNELNYLKQYVDGRNPHLI